MSSVIQKAVILAGGKGTRLHPVTLEIPKPLIPIRKRPLINYNLGMFARYGVDDMKILIRPEDREDYERWAREWGGEFIGAGMNIQFIEEPDPMGTLGYCYHHLRSWMGGEDLFVSNGDDIKNIDLRTMADFHHAAAMLATVALVRERERKDAGFVLVRENKIVDFLEKQENAPSDLVSAGLYLVSPAAFAHRAAGVPAEKIFLMFETDLFPALAKAGKLAGFVDENGKLYDCGTFERWERAIREA